MKQLFRTITNMSKQRGITLTTILLLMGSIFFLTSCQKDDLLIDSRNQVAERTDESRGIERVFKYSKDLILEDGDYYIALKIESDDESAIQDYMDRKPYIIVMNSEDIEAKFVSSADDSSLQTSPNLEKHPRTDGDISITVYESNIPPGYGYSIDFTEESGRIRSKSTLEPGAQNYRWVDTGATKVRTSVPFGMSVEVHYRSRGSQFYNRYWWYHRGFRTLSASSHTFDASDYTSYVGVKISAFCQDYEWDNVSKVVIYWLS